MSNYNTKKANSWEKFGNIKLLTKDDFKQACCNNNSMAKACSTLGLHFGTFKIHAIKYGLYNANQGLKGGTKDFISRKWDLNKWNLDVLIEISRASLRKWILKLKLFPLVCSKCGLDKWLGKNISLELNHINGKKYDNRKSNLELICPNCHAQTDSYRGKNIKK